MEYVRWFGSPSSCKALNKEIVGFGGIAVSRRIVLEVLPLVICIRVLIQDCRYLMWKL